MKIKGTDQWLHSFISSWDKTVFYGSITGILFLALISLYRHSYLKKVEIEMKDKVEIYEHVKQLQSENSQLKHQVSELESKLNQHENNHETE